MERPMMKCGHQANAEFQDKPCCVICAGSTMNAYIVEDSPPDLSGRVARCHCGKERPSIESLEGRLAFFEYCGEGSRSAAICKCGFAPEAHDKTRERFNSNKLRECTENDTYEPRGDRGYDRYYCGCDGWD